MKNHYSVIIVGGGQAGLSMSYCLKERGFDHIVFEKNRIGHSWRSKRWDSFCLVTPNWQCKLPGYHYPGDDPNGFMQKDEIVKYIEHYAKSFDPPVKEGVEVSKVRKSRSQDVFELTTSIGDYTANQVVIAAGSYHIPKIPKIAERLPEHIVQIHSSDTQPELAHSLVQQSQSILSRYTWDASSKLHPYHYQQLLAYSQSLNNHA